MTSNYTLKFARILRSERARAALGTFGRSVVEFFLHLAEFLPAPPPAFSFQLRTKSSSSSSSLEWRKLKNRGTLFMKRLESSGGTSSSIPIPKPNRVDLPNSTGPQFHGPFRQLPPSPDSAKRMGFPPTHPHFPPSPSPFSQPPSSSHNFFPVPCHSRSLSHTSFFSLGSLPQFSSPSPSADVAMTAPPLAGTSFGRAAGDGLPPRKAHRRSQSNMPSAVFANQFVRQETEWDRERGE